MAKKKKNSAQPILVSISANFEIDVPEGNFEAFESTLASGELSLDAEIRCNGKVHMASIYSDHLSGGGIECTKVSDEVWKVIISGEYKWEDDMGLSEDIKSEAVVPEIYVTTVSDTEPNMYDIKGYEDGGVAVGVILRNGNGA